VRQLATEAVCAAEVKNSEVAGHAPRQRCVLVIGAATHRIVWFQEYLTKMAYRPAKFPTERETEQLLELAERIGSLT